MSVLHRRNFGLLLLVFALLTPAANGQTAASADSKSKPPLDDHQVKKLAEPLLDNVLRGMANGDYDAYRRDFDAVMRLAVDKEKFDRANKETKALFGDYRSRTYLGFMVKGKYTVVLWKARFSGAEDDVLIKLALSPAGEKSEISGLWFQ